MTEQFRLMEKPIGRRLETLTHFMAKCMVFKLLIDANHKAKIERNIGSGIIDCFDFTEGIAYEIETKKNPAYNKKKLENYLKCTGISDIIFIYTEDLSAYDIRLWKAYIQERLVI